MSPLYGPSFSYVQDRDGPPVPSCCAHSYGSCQAASPCRVRNGTEWDYWEDSRLSVEKRSWTSSPAIKSVVYGPEELISPGSFSEMKNLRPSPDPLHYNLHFNKIPGGFYACYKFEGDLSDGLFIETETYPYIFCLCWSYFDSLLFFRLVFPL